MAIKRIKDFIVREWMVIKRIFRGEPKRYLIKLLFKRSSWDDYWKERGE